jgi:hypothetical protein
MTSISDNSAMNDPSEITANNTAITGEVQLGFKKTRSGIPGGIYSISKHCLNI